MKKRGKKTLMESATELAESVRPAIESAMETAVETAKDTVDKAAPILADGRKMAQEKAGPILADGKERAHRGRRRAAAKMAALKEAQASEKLAAFKAAEPEKEKGSKLKKLVLLTGLAAVGSVVFKRLRGAPSKSNWQSSYTPQPAPRQTPAHSTKAASPAETADPVHAEPAAPADDAGAASPDEAIADRATEPHPDTTPDDPAEVVELRAVEDTAASEAPGEAPAASQGGSRKKG
jgi:vacuolar-type H+-ATPase subunit H